MNKLAHPPLREAFPYLQIPAFTGDLSVDAVALMNANGKHISAAHCPQVAAVCIRLAARYGLDRDRMEAAGLLHDTGGIIRGADMLAYARQNRWQLDSAEEAIPPLLHQRFSALLAEELFAVTDAVLLEAIACHTTLRPHATDEDMALFLADKLSWDREGDPPYKVLLEKALEVSLPHAARVYMDYAIDNGLLRIPHGQLLAAREWLGAQLIVNS
jgi:predicted HD superfamily hydrolase involved in NAD metabolism